MNLPAPNSERAKSIEIERRLQDCELSGDVSPEKASKIRGKVNNDMETLGRIRKSTRKEILDIIG